MYSKQIVKNCANASFIRKMFEKGLELAKQYGPENVYDFSIGNPFAEPPVDLRERMKELVDQPGVHRYMPNAGFPDVREKVAAFYSARSEKPIPASHIVMTTGAAGALNVLFKAILNPGERIVTFAPYFVEYGFYAQNVGAHLDTVETESTDFLPNIEGLRQAIKPDTRILLLNSPNNPTGRIYSRQDLEAVAGVLREKSAEFGQPIFLVSDEPYATITYDGHQVPNVLDLYEHAIVVNSFSKSLGLAGERIGYIAVGADVPEVETLMDALIFCNRTLGFNNAPALAQKVVAEYLDVLPDVADYQAKRDLLYKELTALGFETNLPEGAFYFFMKVPANFESSVDFANYVADKHQILVVPGSGFGCEGYVRLSYCVKMEVVERSLKAWQALAAELGLKK